MYGGCSNIIHFRFKNFIVFATHMYCGASSNALYKYLQQVNNTQTILVKTILKWYHCTTSTTNMTIQLLRSTLVTCEITNWRYLLIIHCIVLHCMVWNYSNHNPKYLYLEVKILSYLYCSFASTLLPSILPQNYF